MGMSSKGGGGGSRDYFGHCFGVACQGQLDFVWGLLVNNDLVWPQAKAWDSQIYKAGRTVIWTDGNVYRATAKTEVDPNAFPWSLLAAPYVAGSYAIGDKVLDAGTGFVWENAVAANAAAPPLVIPPRSFSLQKRGTQEPEAVNGWFYVCTPDVWSAGTKFWSANSIVAHAGRLWVNAAGTKDEPGTSGAWVLWKVDYAGTNPLKITVHDMGDVYIYWGTSDQVLDTVDEKILDQLGHPPYRNKAGCMLKNFLFGTMQATPPDVVLMGGRKPVQSLISGDAAELDVDWQANPFAILAEILTHPVLGLGLPASWFDATSWQAEADRCSADPDLHNISPLWTSTAKVRELVQDVMSYPDAFLFMSSLATLMAGHWPHGEDAPPFDSTNTIDRNVLVSEISSRSGLWGETSNSVQVSCDDVQSGFNSRPAFAQNLFNLAVVQRMQSKQVDRQHITRFDQASRWAAEFSKLAGDQSMTGELVVRAERAAAIEVGDIFLMTDDVLGISVPMRCVRKTTSGPPTGTAKIGYELERGVSSQPYSPTRGNPVPFTGPPPTRITNFTAIQLPSALGPASSIAILASRTNDVTSMFSTWFRQADSGSFQRLGESHAFALSARMISNSDDEVTAGSPAADNVKFIVLGAVTAGSTYALGWTRFWQHQVFYSANVGGLPAFLGTEGTDYVIDPDTGDLTILSTGAITTGKYVRVKLWKTLALVYDLDGTTTPQSDVDAILASLTLDEQDDGEIILVAVQAANTALIEIMTVEQVVAVGPTALTFGGPTFPTLFADVRRARFGSIVGGDGSHVWGGDDLIYILRRDALVALTHVSFPGFQSLASTMSVRLAPASAWEAADVADLFDPATNPAGLATQFDYVWSNVYAPTVSWGSLQKNGVDISSFAGSFASTDVLSFAFTLADSNGDLRHAALVAVQGQQEITIWSSNFTPTGSTNITVNFSLPKGTWSVQMRMLDGAGNQSTAQLEFSGSPVLVYVDGGTASAPILYSWLDKNGYRTQLLFGLLPGVAANFLVKYQLQNRNVALNPASWISCAVSGAAIGGLYRWGDATYGTLPPIKKNSSGQTLYAYCTQTGKADSAVVKWSF